jgi:hypothetical protein
LLAQNPSGTSVARSNGAEHVAFHNGLADHTWGEVADR